jgi:hypothetical protein
MGKGEAKKEGRIRFNLSASWKDRRKETEAVKKKIRLNYKLLPAEKKRK